VSYLGKAMKVEDGKRSWHSGQGIGVPCVRKYSLSLVYGRGISPTARVICDVFASLTYDHSFGSSLLLKTTGYLKQRSIKSEELKLIEE
jgi:hypothetical protein